MNCLHLIQTSTPALLKPLISLIEGDDAVVLMSSDAQALQAILEKLPATVVVYTLDEGAPSSISNTNDQKVVNYPQLVELCTEYARTMSW